MVVTIKENESLIGFNPQQMYGTAKQNTHEEHPHGNKRLFTTIALVLVLSIHSFITGIALGLQP